MLRSFWRLQLGLGNASRAIEVLEEAARLVTAPPPPHCFPAPRTHEGRRPQSHQCSQKIHITTVPNSLREAAPRPVTVHYLSSEL